MTYETQTQGDLLDLLGRLEAIERDAHSELVLVQEKLPELRRQVRARPKRRGGEGSADEEKYRLGSVLVQLGFSRADDVALLGFLASGDRALQWLAEARLAQGPLPFRELVRAALAAPGRADWCWEWGHYRSQIRKKLIYDVSVTEFIESGRTGPKERWRRLPVTTDQDHIIEDICRAAEISRPCFANRGEAFEWIYENGGNPAHWQSPTEPAEWKE